MCKQLFHQSGTNLEHAWINGNCTGQVIHEITIQFHEDLFSNELSRYQFRTVKEMFEKARNGLLFSRETALKAKPMLLDLGEEKNGFYSFLKLMKLMYELSIEDGTKVLSSPVFANTQEDSDSRRVKKVLTFLQE